MAIATLFAFAASAAGPAVSILRVDESTVTGTLVGLKDGRIVLSSPDATIPLVDLVNLVPKTAGTAGPVNTNVRKLTGKVIGTEGSYKDEGRTRDKAFDGDRATYFDAPADHGDDAWVGLDLGSPKVITEIRFFPRPGRVNNDQNSKRMKGGKFQGSSTEDFSGKVVDIFVLPGAPTPDAQSTQSVSIATPWRYVRYAGPSGSHCNVAEIEFWGKDPGPAPALPAGVQKGLELMEKAKPAVVPPTPPPAAPGQNVRPDGRSAGTKPATSATTSPATLTAKSATTLPATLPATSAAPAPAIRAILGGDEQFTGPMLGWSEKQLRVGTPFGRDGGLDIPIEALHEIWKGTAEQVKQAKAVALDPGPEDAAFVVKDNGVVAVRGIAMGVAATEAGDALRFKFNDEERKINLSKLVGVILGGNDAKRDKSLRQTLQLANGDSVSGTWQGYDPVTNAIGLRTPWGATLDVPFGGVLRVSSVNGRLSYLTDMKPVNVEQTPYFDRLLPYQVNRSLTGGPLKLSDGDYPRGIAVHSRTVLAYDTGGQFEEFKVKVGFQQPEGKQGQAVVRVSGDGKVLYENLDARGDAKPADVSVKVAGVKQLSLEVDFGRNEDTGDRVVWANPRLLKAKGQ